MLSDECQFFILEILDTMSAVGSPISVLEKEEKKPMPVIKSGKIQFLFVGQLSLT